MAEDNKSRFASILGTNSSTMLAVAVMLILGIMLLPMPTFLLDMFLVMNITGALVIIFVAMYVLRPLEFSVFPGLLLIVTLFRLSLNVATTRLILGEAYAGEIIASFGNFVVGGNYIVGAVIFLILVIINFVVITKGSTRIAEVSARFTLDAMPGKQMSIDADLNAGLIDDDQARKRREMISQEADFYGSMDGASKFVRGDAVAGILMTLINIIGGLAIGTLQLGMKLGEAASTYTLLTIGDGLVAQIPALIISTAAGIIVTRATSESDFAADIQSQVTKQPKAVMVSSGVVGIIGLMPGMPFLPFAVMAGVLATIGYRATKSQSEVSTVEAPEAEAVIEEEKIESFLHPDPFEIEIGYGLIPLVDTNQGG
ncbi:MAG TPA: flagellar biosynthesis protein FlhA, partial [Candidatus Marinimicrobia bacterium]|nr:flagellar biosynthesis protein FlhA [Candidatus Neomarinimicrobiota bacterium]